VPAALDLVSILVQHTVPEPKLALPLGVIGLDPREPTLGRRHVSNAGALDSVGRAVVAGTLELGTDGEGRNGKRKVLGAPAGIRVAAAPGAGEGRDGTA